MKPIIGITSGEIVNINQPWGPIAYGQKHTYSDAIIAAGGIPVVIPFMPKAELRILYERLDGVLFAGGNDINPALYDEAPHPLTHDVSDARDTVENTLMAWTLADNKPLFAICRGMQLLNVHLGGSLYQDLLTQLPGVSDHEESANNQSYRHIAHELRITPESRLASISNVQSIKANTVHHQGVNRLGTGLTVNAWAEDGVIEGVELAGKSFVLGLQCHPEGLHDSDEAWARVFKAFVQEAAKQVIPARLFTLKRPIRQSKRLGLFLRKK